MLFKEFVDNKERLSRDRLKLIGKMFEQNGMKIKESLDTDQPYIFVYAPEDKLSFDGIRIYPILDTIAYRVQKRFDVQPYGKAYNLNIEQMFDDLSHNKNNMKEVGKEVIKNVVHEVKSFFQQAVKAEKESTPSVNDPLNNIYVRYTGTDYANRVLDNRRN